MPVEETEELDTSVIINPNARTLRSGTTIVQQEEQDEEQGGEQEEEQEELAIESETGTSLNPTETVKEEQTSETPQTPVVDEEVSGQKCNWMNNE